MENIDKWHPQCFDVMLDGSFFGRPSGGLWQHRWEIIDPMAPEIIGRPRWPRKRPKDPLEISKLQTNCNIHKRGQVRNPTVWQWKMISGSLAPKKWLWKHFFSPRIKISSKLTERRGILRLQLLQMYPRIQILSGSFWDGLSPSRNVYNHLIRIHAFHVPEQQFRT